MRLSPFFPRRCDLPGGARTRLSSRVVGKGWLGGDVSSAHRSGQDALHDVAVDIGQAEIAALDTEGQPLMVEAE